MKVSATQVTPNQVRLLKESLAEVCGPKVCLKLCPVK
jgi:hypothetical protein